MKKRFYLLGGLLFLGTASANIAKAVCPVCIVAVSTGLGLSRWLGVDDVISSIWIGALLASTSIWTLTWLKLKNWDFKYSKFVIPVSFYLLTLVPLYYAEVIGHPLNKIFGIDRIIFGTVLGTVVFLVGVWLNNFLKEKNQGKQFFSYQKVVVPFLVLLAVSLLIFFLLR